MQFIDNKEENGIKYNWSEIAHTYKGLNVPKEYFNPFSCKIENNTYFMLLSERATGKTTNLLLVGMIMNQMYGTTIQYIRQKDDMIKPSNAIELFNVIRHYNNGEYIRKITNGKWTDIYYHWKSYYFCNYDENGLVKDKAPEPFCKVLSIDKANSYKSSYNAPTGDFVIFDEFIGKMYMPNEFVDFMDLLSTILRKRRSGKIFMLANTLTIVSQYFKEFELTREIPKAKRGDIIVKQTKLGTRIFFMMIDQKDSNKKAMINNLYFGFENEKLASITGSNTYAIEVAPRIQRKDDFKVLCENRVLDTDLGYYRIKIGKCNHTPFLCVHITPTTNIKPTDKLYSNDIVYDKQYYRGLMWDKVDKLWLDLYKKGFIYYDSNETQTVLQDYLRTAYAYYNR